MSPFEYCKKILTSEDIEDKIFPYCGDMKSIENNEQTFVVNVPARSASIAFSEDQIKFPKAGSLHLKAQRAKALHFFANHELLAIEMMAQAICQFRDMPDHLVRSLMGTIAEEQKHFRLYNQRMKDFGLNFGDYPLNAFFWTYMSRIDSYQAFFAVVSLTFEQANLDFASHYEKTFREIGDVETAEILKTVYEDEIKHVARGYTVLKKESADDIWEYYQNILPDPLTPARAKGMIFDEKGRRLAGMSAALIESVKKYQNDFKITKRKSWKN
jgi:uncharacterized ferritin-like protein (DUF455 family)